MTEVLTSPAASFNLMSVFLNIDPLPSDVDRAPSSSTLPPAPPPHPESAPVLTPTSEPPSLSLPSPPPPNGGRSTGIVGAKVKTQTGETKYQCQYADCQAFMSTPAALQKHINSIHLRLREHKCTFQGCGKSFAQKGTLDRHIRTHTKKTVATCSHCNKNFTDTTDWRRHEATHTNKRPYWCTLGCKERGFFGPKPYARHIQKLHKAHPNRVTELERISKRKSEIQVLESKPFDPSAPREKKMRDPSLKSGNNKKPKRSKIRPPEFENPFAGMNLDQYEDENDDDDDEDESDGLSSSGDDDIGNEDANANEKEAKKVSSDRSSRRAANRSASPSPAVGHSRLLSYDSEEEANEAFSRRVRRPRATDDPRDASPVRPPSSPSFSCSASSSASSSSTSTATSFAAH